MASVTYAMSFAAYFATVVLIPLWLQQNMGYTATWAGYATGIMGIFAVLSSPAIGAAAAKMDLRLLISIGIAGMALISLWRTAFTPDMTFLQMAWPMLLTGPFLMMFFIPVTGLCIASVEPHEHADAAGISNFLRTLAAAFATSLVQTGWTNAARFNQAELVGAMQQGPSTIDALVASGQAPETAVALLTNTVESQSVMLATLNMFAVVALCLAFTGVLIWLAPKPQGPIDTSGGH